MTIKQYLRKLKKFPNYKEYISWVLKNGKSFNSVGKLSIKEKELLSRNLHGTNVRECYYNSQMLSVNHPAFKYYEGWYLFNDLPLPMEHGFNVLRGKVIDTTCFERTRAKKIKYFGVHIPTEFIRERMSKTGMAQNVLSRYYYTKTHKETTNE